MNHYSGVYFQHYLVLRVRWSKRPDPLKPAALAAKSGPPYIRVRSICLEQGGDKVGDLNEDIQHEQQFLKLVYDGRIKLHFFPSSLPSGFTLDQFVPDPVVPDPKVPDPVVTMLTAEPSTSDSESGVPTPFRVELLPTFFHGGSRGPTGSTVLALIEAMRGPSPDAPATESASGGLCCHLVPETEVAPRNGKDDRDHVFQIVCPTEWNLEVPDPKGLVCKLLPFQRRALSWMLWREGGKLSPQTRKVSGPSAGAARDPENLDPPEAFSGKGLYRLLWSSAPVEMVLAADGKSPAAGALHSASAKRDVYVNRFTLRAQMDAPQEPASLKGGMLSDEMGLGKTIECIALMLLHPPDEGWVQRGGSPGASISSESLGAGPPAAEGSMQARMPRGPSLVVTPPNLVQQWVAELNDRAPSLSVVIYDGVDELTKPPKQPRRRGHGSSPPDFQPVDPVAILTTCDVVIATYSVLQAEVNYVPCERSFRQPKRYFPLVTPLLQIHWWRMMLDEAQMIVGSQHLSETGKMARRISAEHRWNVTGTPIGAGGLGDLIGQLKALRVDRFEETAVFKKLIWRPYLEDDSSLGLQPLRDLLKPIMWRNNKVSTAKEHDLPPRRLQQVVLQLSHPEKSIYKSILDSTLAAHKERSKAAHDGKKIKTEKDQQKIAALDLNQLRLAAIHPQLTQHWKLKMGRELQTADGVLSVVEVLERFRDQDHVALQAAERDYCSAANLLALRIATRLGLFDDSEKSEPHEHGDVLMSEQAAEGAAAPPTSKKRNQKAVRFAGDYADADKAGYQGQGQPQESADPSATAYPRSRKQAHLNQILELLQKSYTVGESGIRGEDIELDNNAIRSWRFVQVHTTSMLSRLHTLLGNTQEAEAYAQECQDKMDELCSGHNISISKSQHKLEKTWLTSNTLMKSCKEDWSRANEHGFSCTTAGYAQNMSTTAGHAQDMCSTAGHVQSMCTTAGHAQIMSNTAGRAQIMSNTAGHAESMCMAPEGSSSEVVPDVAQAYDAGAWLKEMEHLLAAAKDEEFKQRNVSKTERGEVLQSVAILGTRVSNLLTAEERVLVHTIHLIEDALSKRLLAPLSGAITSVLDSVNTAIGQQAQASASGKSQPVVPPASHRLPVGIPSASHDFLPEYRIMQSLLLTPAGLANGVGRLAAGAAALCTTLAASRAFTSLLSRTADRVDVVLKKAGQSAVLVKGFLDSEESGKGSTEAVALLRCLWQVRSAGKLTHAKLEALLAAQAGLQKQIQLLHLWKAEHIESLHLETEKEKKEAALERLKQVAEEGDPSIQALSCKTESQVQEYMDNMQAKALTLNSQLTFKVNQIREARDPMQPVPPSNAGKGPSGDGSTYPPADGDGQPGSPATVCPTCYEDKDDWAILQSCSHFFCYECIVKTFEAAKHNHYSGAQCPLCRAHVKKEEVFRVSKLQPAGRGPHHPEPEPPEGPEFLAVKVNGQWMSKIEGIVRRVLFSRMQQPDEKILVFSQYDEALRLFKRALAMNGVKSTMLTGNRKDRRAALKSFNEDDDVAVLLLRLKKDGSGLTLVRANHVFLLEPSLDPAVEQQAVARVHRIGQKRNVFVTRMLVDGTVEMEILKRLLEKQQLFCGHSHDTGDNFDGVDEEEDEMKDLDSAAAVGPCSEVLADREAVDLLDAMMQGT